MLKKMEFEVIVWGVEEVRLEEVKSEERSFPRFDQHLMSCRSYL